MPAYTLSMKILLRPLFIVCYLLLAACGPKDIGTGTSTEYAAGDTGPSHAEQMRYPMTGASNLQRNLYYYNRPHIMQNMQQWRVDRFRQQLLDRQGPTAVDPSDPAYRSIPRERSPFRQ